MLPKEKIDKLSEKSEMLKGESMAVVYFGTENYPLIDYDDAGKIGARASDIYPLKLETDVQAPDGVDLNDYVFGLYIRNLPTRSLIKATNSEMDLRNQVNDPALRIYASGFLGAPGTGKTFFYSLLGKMTHEKGPILVDCSDKDLKTLFENPTFDSDAAYREKNAIDAKIKLRNMGKKESISDKSLSMLKQIVGSAWHEDEGGQITIDWSAIHFEGKDIADYERHIKIFQNILREICQDEGINLSSSSTDIGITMEDGELFRVFDPQSPDYGRPIILDELNRAKKGTLDNLYGILNFLNAPNMRTYTITGANGRTLTIDKDSPTFPKTFYLNFTGNQAVDRMGSNKFNDPFLSRIPEGFALKTIPDTKPEDYADMICSYLTGVPAITLCQAFNINIKNQSDLNNFIDFLKSARTIGLTKQQQKQIPEWQMHNIDHIAKIILLSEQMGQFFYDIKDIINLRGTNIQTFENMSIEPEYERYLSSKQIDFRTIPHFFIQADQIKGTVSQPQQPILGSKNKKTIKPIEIQKSERYATRGNRLQAVMNSWLEETFCPSDRGIRCITEETVQKFYDMALECAAINGILPKQLDEAKSIKKLIADLYNIDIVEAGLYFKQLQSLIVQSLRRTNPDIHPDEADEDILPVGVVQATMALFAKEEGKSILEAARQANNLLVLNEDVDEIGNNMIMPASLQGDTNSTDTSDISDENLLLSLSFEELGTQNLKKLFQITPQFEALSAAEKEENGSSELYASYQTYLNYDCDKINDDDGNEIISSCIKFGFFKVKNALTGNPSYLLAFYNKTSNHLVIIGDEIAPEIEAKFFKKGVRTYYNRNKTNAQTLETILQKEFFSEDFLAHCALLDIYNWVNLKSDTPLTLQDIVTRTAEDYADQDSRVTTIKYSTDKSPENAQKKVPNLSALRNSSSRAV